MEPELALDQPQISDSVLDRTSPSVGAWNEPGQWIPGKEDRRPQRTCPELPRVRYGAW